MSWPLRDVSRTVIEKRDDVLVIEGGMVDVPGPVNFNFNFGLGTKIAMSEQIAARIEGRWRITDTSFNTSSGIWCDPWGYCYNYASSWYNSGELIGGLTYRF